MIFVVDLPSLDPIRYIPGFSSKIEYRLIVVIPFLTKLMVRVLHSLKCHSIASSVKGIRVNPLPVRLPDATSYSSLPRIMNL